MSNKKQDEAEDPINRSERKRQREKQRRSDLTSAFDELASVIVAVDPEQGRDFASGQTNKKGRRSSISSRTDGDESGGTTRLDLIGKAVRVIRQLHQENEYRKQVMEQTKGHGGGALGGVAVGKRGNDNNVSSKT
jgi:hypothetical protein